MKHRAIFFLFTLTGFACTTFKPVATVRPKNNPWYEVEYLFEHDGCRVYRFEDNGNKVYFTNCTGEAISFPDSTTVIRNSTKIKNR